MLSCFPHYLSLLTQIILHGDTPSLVAQENTTHHILVSISRIVWIRHLVYNGTCHAPEYK